MSYGRMEKEEKRLREEIDRILEKTNANDQAEDQEYGNQRGDDLPAELANREKRLETIMKAKAELEAEARAKQEQEEAQRQTKNDQEDNHTKSKDSKPQRNRKRKRKRKDAEPKDAKPKAKDQRNFTDPDSRIMRNSDKAFIQAYNAQASVDAETHIIVAADLTNQAADTTHLPEQIEQVCRNLGGYPKEISTDAGYHSTKNLEILAENAIEAFIPPDKVKHSEWREQKTIRGPIPRDASPTYLMRRKLTTKRGRNRYKLRQTSVEPVFGHIKEQLGLRQFLLRGLAKARSWWRFTCAVHNLLKIQRSGIRLIPAPGNGLWALFNPTAKA